MAQRTTVPSGQAYGDIFYVQTPALDRWGQQLYAEQKQREARSYQEGQVLDANIQKELGKVRSIDTPEVINNYQQYKAIKKELMFNDRLKKDPVKYNELQQAANRVYQNIFSTANKSAELNDMQKKLTAGYLQKPDDHADDFGVRMNALMNTPVGQLGQPHPQYGNLTDLNTYLDRGINTDFGKMIKEGIGTEKEAFHRREPIPGGLQENVIPYHYANTPLQVKDYLVGAMGMRQAGKDAAKAWDKLSEDEIATTIKKYQALPPEHWQRMGLKGPQDLFPKNPDSKAENYASYLAMNDAVSRAPREGKPTPVTNLKAVKDLDFARQKQMQSIKNADAQGLIKLKKSIDPNDAELNNTWVESFLANRMSEAKADKSKAHTIYKSSNFNGNGYEIPADPVMMKAFTRGAGSDAREPDKIYVTEDNKIWPIFYKYGKGGKGQSVLQKNKAGHPLIDEDYGGPLSVEQAKLALGYKGQTKKQLSETMKQDKTPTVNIEDMRKKYNYLND